MFRKVHAACHASRMHACMVHFYSRRDLDKACAVSKWLDALIAQCCDVFTLRPVFEVKLLPVGVSDFMPTVFIDASQDPRTYHSLNSVNEAGGGFVAA